VLLIEQIVVEVDGIGFLHNFTEVMRFIVVHVVPRITAAISLVHAYQQLIHVSAWDAITDNQFSR